MTWDDAPKDVTFQCGHCDKLSNGTNLRLMRHVNPGQCPHCGHYKMRRFPLVPLDHPTPPVI